jgi:hypothetical protein
MIITHASHEKIESVESNPALSLCLKGCLCFADEGNTYNLVNECNYQYNLEVDEDNIIDVSRFWYEHEESEPAAQDVFEMMRDDIFGWDDCTDEELAELLDGSADIHDADASWAVQQYQGILAHKLGYDCAKDFDEQGVVYVAYCVDRDLQEVKK